MPHFSTLGPSLVETNYALIVKHLVHELVQTPRSRLRRCKELLVRKLMEVLLRNVIGTQMLMNRTKLGSSESYLLLPLKVASADAHPLRSQPSNAHACMLEYSKR